MGWQNGMSVGVCFTARIAAVHRCIDLNEVIRAGANSASASRDDAGRNRTAEAKRVADRKHPVADARFFGSEFKIVIEFFFRLDFQKRKVGPLIRADDFGLEFILTLELDGDFRSFVHDVMVRYDISVTGDEKA